VTAFRAPRQNKLRAAEISSGFPADAAAVWAPLAEEIEVDLVPGDHLGGIATHYEKLASVSGRLREKHSPIFPKEI